MTNFDIPLRDLVKREQKELGGGSIRRTKEKAYEWYWRNYRNNKSFEVQRVTGYLERGKMYRFD